MRLLHFADLHLGIDNYGTQDARTGVSSRSRDILRALDTIVERAIGDPVDAVLFAGDAFKNRDPNPTLQRELAIRIARLVAGGIPIVLLVGNHDMPGAVGRATAAEIYEVLEVPGVHVARDVSRLDVETRSGLLQVVAVPWVMRSMALVSESLRQLVDADLDEAIRHGISHQVRSLASELDRSLPAVMLAHVSLQGADFGLERSLMLGRDVEVGADDLEASAFDFVALGHIHKHQTLGLRPPVVYAGSPERIDFGEEGEDKGYVIVDIALDENGQRRTTWEFVELPARRFETLRIEAGGDAPMEVIEREIETVRERIKDAVVRAFITVDAEQESSLSVTRIRRLLADCGPFAVAGVRIDTEDQRRARMELDLSEAMDHSRMLERWIESRGYDAERAELIRRLGNELITNHKARESD